MKRVVTSVPIAVAVGLVIPAVPATAAQSSKPKEIVVVGSKIKETKSKKSSPMLFQGSNPSGTRSPGAAGAGGSARRR